MDNFINDEISYFLMITGMRHMNMQNIFSLRTLHDFYEIWKYRPKMYFDIYSYLIVSFV